MDTLEMDGVSLSFGRHKVLRQVYLNCSTGDIIGFIGLNGAGKSCLLNVIFGTQQADEKFMWWNGKKVDQLYRKTGAVTYMPQKEFVMDYLTFNDLARIYNIGEDMDRIITIDEIRRNACEKMGRLSKGTRRLMELMTVLYVPSSFTLLDEPFSFLSPKLVGEIIPHIQHQSKKKGIILTDHLQKDLYACCNRFYLLSEGRLQEAREASGI